MHFRVARLVGVLGRAERVVRSDRAGAAADDLAGHYPVALIQTPTTGVPELAWCLIWRYASYVLVSSRVFLKDYIQEWKGEE